MLSVPSLPIPIGDPPSLGLQHPKDLRHRQERVTIAMTDIPMTDVTDGALMERLRGGDAQALGQIYDRYNGLVYSLALRILGDRQEAEDLTQEIFLKLYRQDKYDPKRGSLASYLSTLTRSRAIDRVRSRSNRQQILHRWRQDMFRPDPKLPTEQLLLKSRREQVRFALTQLSDIQRQVLELAYYEGLSQSEIAKRLEKPLGSVKSWSRKGLLKLRNLLGEVSDNV